MFMPVPPCVWGVPGPPPGEIAAWSLLTHDPRRPRPGPVKRLNEDQTLGDNRDLWTGLLGWIGDGDSRGPRWGPQGRSPSGAGVLLTTPGGGRRFRLFQVWGPGAQLVRTVGVAVPGWGVRTLRDPRGVGSSLLALLTLSTPLPSPADPGVFLRAGEGSGGKSELGCGWWGLGEAGRPGACLCARAPARWEARGPLGAQSLLWVQRPGLSASVSQDW